jgi:hypothetical protein
MRIASPGIGHITVAWKTDTEVEEGLEVGPEAPKDAEIVDEATARAIFDRIVNEEKRAFAFDSTTDTPVQILRTKKGQVEFPSGALVIETVPVVVGG